MESMYMDKQSQNPKHQNYLKDLDREYQQELTKLMNAKAKCIESRAKLQRNKRNSIFGIIFAAIYVFLILNMLPAIMNK